jgi:putative two-component system response regulator
MLSKASWKAPRTVAEARRTVAEDHDLNRILIVDDDEQITRLMTRLLGGDYVCEVASNVAEARQRLGENQFELALIDVNMPGESGLDLLAHLRAEHPQVAALMVTGMDDRQLAATVLENGAYGYIVKPFKPSEFQINVANTLRRHRLEIENRNYQQRLEETVEYRTVELKGAIVRLEEAQREVRSSREETIQRLARAVEFRSAETGRHIERMSLYSGLLARRVGLESGRCDLIQSASAMHDIGKVGIPDGILHKPGKLTAEEFEIIKQHAEIGYHIFADSTAELLALAAKIALTHHERWDGSGYPGGLAETQIPVEARIASVADVFDALTSPRVYKAAYDVEEALEIMRDESGRQFDPDLLEVFLRSLDDVLAIREQYRDPDDSSASPHLASAHRSGRR